MQVAATSIIPSQKREVISHHSRTHNHRSRGGRWSFGDRERRSHIIAMRRSASGEEKPLVLRNLHIGFEILSKIPVSQTLSVVSRWPKV
jgi:hypothetical protein